MHRVDSCPHISAAPEPIDDEENDTEVAEHETTKDASIKDQESPKDVINQCSESTKVLARFCVDAPSVEIRDCIRQYSESKTYKQQTTSFNAYSKNVIVETLSFLGATHKNWNDHKKSACVHELIYKIQSLLPETCGICKDSYTIQKNDDQLLSCSVCKQEVHRACYTPLLKTGENSFSVAILKIPGMHYLCPTCEYELIPDENIGLKKKKNIIVNESSKISVEQRMGTPCTSDNSNSIKSFCPQEKSSQKLVSPGPTVIVQANQKSSKENTTDNSTKDVPAPAKTCNKYRNNNCEFGMKGKGCQFHHPKRCTKLMTHGTKADKGCNLGKKCPEFHPKMCPSSITKGECFDDRCQLCHVKGTQRKKPEKTKDTKKKFLKVQGDDNAVPPETDESSTDLTPKSLQKSFLDQISLMKKEISEAVDSKISALLQQSTLHHQQNLHQHSLPMPVMPQQHPAQQQIPRPHHQQMLPSHLPYHHPMQMWYPPYNSLMSPVPQVYQLGGSNI